MRELGRAVGRNNQLINTEIGRLGTINTETGQFGIIHPEIGGLEVIILRQDGL